MRAIVPTIALALLSTTVLAVDSCRPAGQRCIGAEGRPPVKWIPCCGGECTAVLPGKWGKFCSGGASGGTASSGGASSSGKYQPGQRCAGAPGKPAVPWKGCEGGSCTVTKAGQWGTFCSGTPTSGNYNGGGGAPAPADGDKYLPGQRCAGAPGKPAVDWKGCVGESQCSTPCADWGTCCSALAGYPSAPAGPAPYKPGQRCQGAPGYPMVPYLGCVAGSTCSVKKSYDWGTFCSGTSSGGGNPTTPVVTNPQVTTPVVTDPQVTTPVVTDPQVTTPVVTDPQVTTPTATDPQVTTPTVTDPQVTTPVVTTPVVTTPVVTTNAPTGPCEGLTSVRPAAIDVTQGQWTAFVEGIQAMRDTPDPNGSGVSIYERFAQIHSENGAHFGAAFLPWHRVMLWEFEKECNRLRPGCRIPAFDWSIVNTNVFSSPVFGNNRLGSSVSTNGDNNAPIPNGSFQGLTSAADGTDNLVTRNFDASIDLDGRQTLDTAISSLPAFATFTAFVEGVHNNFHVSMGGEMNSLQFSPNEPAFYMHHAFIDKIWREWQLFGNGNKYGGQQPADGGANVQVTDQMQPWGRTVQSILEDISGCVTYNDGSNRPAFFNPVARFAEIIRMSPTLAKQRPELAHLDAAQLNSLLSRAAPVNTDAKGKAFIDSSGPAQKAKLKTKTQKLKLVELAAKDKKDNTKAYIQKVKKADKILQDTVNSCQKLGMPQFQIGILKATYSFLKLKMQVDMTDAKDQAVINEDEAEVKKEAEQVVQAIESNNIDALPEAKKDVDGTESDVAVPVEDDGKQA